MKNSSNYFLFLFIFWLFFHCSIEVQKRDWTVVKIVAAKVYLYPLDYSDSNFTASASSLVELFFKTPLRRSGLYDNIALYIANVEEQAERSNGKSRRNLPSGP